MGASADIVDRLWKMAREAEAFAEADEDGAASELAAAETLRDAISEILRLRAFATEGQKAGVVVHLRQSAQSRDSQ